MIFFPFPKRTLAARGAKDVELLGAEEKRYSTLTFCYVFFTDLYYIHVSIHYLLFTICCVVSLCYYY
jgi:hypothetical protein